MIAHISISLHTNSPEKCSIDEDLRELETREDASALAGQQMTSSENVCTLYLQPQQGPVC